MAVMTGLVVHDSGDGTWLISVCSRKRQFMDILCDEYGRLNRGVCC